MGPSPKSLAADAHDCIMARMLERPLDHPPNTRLWRDGRHVMAGSPPIVCPRRRPSPGRRRLTRMVDRRRPSTDAPKPKDRSKWKVNRWQDLPLTTRVPYKVEHVARHPLSTTPMTLQ
jgi:hypothetical protein